MTRIATICVATAFFACLALDIAVPAFVLGCAAALQVAGQVAGQVVVSEFFGSTVRDSGYREGKTA